MNATDAIKTRGWTLQKAAAVRWLVKDELVFLLLHYKLLDLPIYQTPQLKPPSGSLLFYDVSGMTASEYKKDGWRWQKRKDNSGRVREDRAKLVLNREVIVLGTYVHSSDIATFHRRSYSLRGSDQNIVLVHYFDEVNRIIDDNSETPTISRSLTLESGDEKGTSGLKRSLSGQQGAMQKNTTPRYPLKPSMSTESGDESVDSIMKSCFEMDYVPHQNHHYQNQFSKTVIDTDLDKHDPMSEFSALEDEMLYSDIPSVLSKDSESHFNDTQKSNSNEFGQTEISDFTPDWDFLEGGAKVLICLVSALPRQFVNDSQKLFVQFGPNKRVPADKISDTVLRCTAPNGSNTGTVQIFVCYSHHQLDTEFIQLSQAKLFTYRSHQQVSPLLPAAVVEREKILLEKEMREVDPWVSPLSLASNSMGKRVRSPGGDFRSTLNGDDDYTNRRGRRSNDSSNLSLFVDTDLDERQCKIRVVERLSEFHHTLRTTSSSGDLGLNENMTYGKSRIGMNIASFKRLNSDIDVASGSDQAVSNYALHPSVDPIPADVGDIILAGTEVTPALDDCNIEALSDKELEQLSEKLLERVVRQLVTIADTSEELLEELNSLDETGLSLLHYVSFYNYAQLIPVLLSHGAHINQQSTQGQTALHLAAGCGHQDVVDALVQSDSDLFMLDFDGLTAADRAEKSGHLEVAMKLRRLMGARKGSIADEGGICGRNEDVSFVEDEVMDGSSPAEYFMDTDTVDKHDEETSSEFLGEQSRSGTFDSPQKPAPTPGYVGEAQEHNRKLLMGAFSTMSLHDKCALSLSISRDSAASNARRRGSSVTDESFSSCGATTRSQSSSPCQNRDFDGMNGGLGLSENDNLVDSEVKSVIADDEENLSRLEAAMALMGPEERQSLEEEVKILQHNVRAWLLRRNCKNMRETTKRLNEATKSIADQQKQQEAQQRHHTILQHDMSERERAAVTVQAATRSMLARKSFLQTKNVAIKFQAATRGVLCRKNFAHMKTHALASLVIQRNVREWWHKQPSAIKTHPIVVATSGQKQNEDEDATYLTTEAKNLHLGDPDDSASNTIS